jgi:hypothetical protein
MNLADVKKPTGAEQMYKKVRAIFFAILVVFILAIFTMPNLGGYLAYIAIPALAVLGLTLLFTNPKPEEKTQISNNDSLENKAIDIINDGVDSIGKLFNSLDKSTIEFQKTAEEANEKSKLASVERKKKLDEEYNRLTPEQKKIFDNLK